jgi:excisionase family DNA binding protein
VTLLDWTAIALSVRLAAVVCGVLLVIALPTAYWLTFSRWRWKFLVEAVVALPLVLPPTVLGFYPGGPDVALLTVRAAAERLGVGYSTLKQWIYRGRVRTTQTAGGHHRISDAEIDRLVARHAPRRVRPVMRVASVAAARRRWG